jgi:hypothetical protein
MDDEIRQEVLSQAKKWNLGVRVDTQLQNRASTYRLTTSPGGADRTRNKLLMTLRDIGAHGPCSGKHVPYWYKVGSRQTRLQVLAGLIDTDGSLNSGCYEYVSKSKRLADDVAFMARSVGLAVTCSVKTVKGVIYHRLSLCGDLTIIPVRIPRKARKSFSV